MPVSYEDVKIDCGYRLDVLVEDKIIVEIKAVVEILPVHKAQLITYLKLSGKKLGFLINFNTTRFKDGIKRMANKL